MERFKSGLSRSSDSMKMREQGGDDGHGAEIVSLGARVQSGHPRGVVLYRHESRSAICGKPHPPGSRTPGLLSNGSACV